ncbi:cyclopropane-fatty-acyl-phospholipid synthase family protein [uncultured Thiothrix sp.]|uniref:SAM-dependent methyltransferase n=1 Tax=uncultured Thiothrix sp. TaxID=223185 RepID=UPI0026227967|nr:cyclopropane-fatty-acyl-phospholipid synthase family protein [uncultured Thiothrix sp.]
MKTVETSLTQENTSLRWRDQVAQKVLFKLLSQLQHGYLSIQDQEQLYTFGQQGQGLQAHISVHNRAIYSKVLLGGGSLAAGETYVQGWWDSPDVTKVIRLLLRNRAVLDRLDHGFSFFSQWGHRIAHTFKPNSKQGAKKNIVAHYDLGNEFYKLFLDPTMMYSSAIFPKAEMSLYEAQVYKLDSICQRLALKPNEHLLEIGTGWGGMAVYAAEHYGVKVTTTTISEAQYAYVQQLIAQKGLQDRITLLKQDYRELTGQYDKLVSIEMIEAVGHQHLPTFFQQCQRLLKPHGRLLIQAITIADQRYDRYRHQADFIQRYIFPGGFLPSIHAMSEQIMRHTSLKITGLHDMGLDYAHTLKLWSHNLQAQQDQLAALGLDHAFYRLWQFYLHYCEGGFRERLISTVHLVADQPEYAYEHPTLCLD